MTIVINGTTGISGVDGSAGTPAVQGTDTNTGEFFPAADTVAWATNGSERMRIDSSGNVGIGTTNPLAKLHVNTTSAALYIGYGANFDNYIQTNNNTYFTNYNGSTEYGRFDSSGNFRFNSGYGSVATAYGCRAWVNFNGTTSPGTIRGSGNVTSVTKNGTGDYTVNFTNAMPDANYSMPSSSANTGPTMSIASPQLAATPFTTTTARVETRNTTSGALLDCQFVCLGFFR